MRIINYSINVSDVRTTEDEPAPLVIYSGVYPSEAFKTPQELAQSIVDFLNEEFGLEMTVVTAVKIREFSQVDSVSSMFDEATIKARQDRIAKNKRELGFIE